MAKKSKPDSQKQNKQFLMRASDDFLHKLDEYRRQQPDLPGRAEAIRRLVEQALSASKKR